MSRRQRQIKELEFAKPIKIPEPKQFEGKPGDDFETWWILIQVYIEDQPEKFPKDERTINWKESSMDRYATAWHIQWLIGTLNGTHPKLMTGYISALKLRFEDWDAKDEAYANLEEVRYEGCIRDMFTKIQMYNNKAWVTGAALKKLSLERLPQKILEQMHTVDLTGKTDQDIITIIMNAGRMAEKWDAARKNLGLNVLLRSQQKYQKSSERSNLKEKRESSWKERKPKNRVKKDRFRKKDCKEFQETEGIEASELERRKAAGECLRCPWPSDRNGSHTVKDCKRPIKLDKSTASYPKVKEYHKMKIAGMQLDSDSDSKESEQNSMEEYTGEDCGSEEEESEGEVLDESETEEEQVSTERNWWDSESNSD